MFRDPFNIDEFKFKGVSSIRQDNGRLILTIHEKLDNVIKAVSNHQILHPDHGHPRANFVGTVGQASRSNEPMIFSTELARNYISLAEIEMEKELELSKDELDALDDTTLGKLRTLFKMRLPGMINVRTDGNSVYAMRVATGYWWEAYGPLELHPRSNST